jgi:hypothetical protein
LLCSSGLVDLIRTWQSDDDEGAVEPQESERKIGEVELQYVDEAFDLAD